MKILKESKKIKNFNEYFSFLERMEAGEEYANFLNKEEQIKNNSSKNIREIKRLLCRCLNSKKVQGFELSQWSEIVNLPSVFASLTFYFRFTSDGVILTGVVNEGRDPDSNGFNILVKQSMSRGR